MLRSLTAAVYVNAYRIFHLLHSGSQTLFEGFWLGFLPDSVTDLVSEWSYGEGNEYTGAAWLDSGLQFWEEIAVDRFFTPGCSVLVAAAGGGRELIALARRGYKSAGFDCCRSMVSAGQRALSARGIDSRIEWAPPCRIPQGLATWDAAIIGWNGYTYISPRSRRIEFMKSLRPHLRPGAPVLVSGAIRPGKSGQLVWTPRIANAVRRLTFRRPVFGTGSCFPGRPRHQFARRELEGELSEAGFSPVAFWRWGPFGAVVCLNRGLNSNAPDPVRLVNCQQR
jgi:hypothetical protein